MKQLDLNYNGLPIRARDPEYNEIYWIKSEQELLEVAEQLDIKWFDIEYYDEDQGWRPVIIEVDRNGQNRYPAWIKTRSGEILAEGYFRNH